MDKATITLTNTRSFILEMRSKTGKGVIRKVIFEELHEECGVFGVFSHPDSAHLVYLGLTALQHRGQESAGIVSYNAVLHRHVGMGLVFDVFKKEHFNFLKGNSAIGHVRYSTAGASTEKNAQPLLVTTAYGKIALAHNGNLTNAALLRKQLESDGAIFQSSSDSEVILHLIARAKEKNFKDAICSALAKVEGAYSLLFLIEESGKEKGCSLVAVRDPLGFRPLLLGKTKTSSSKKGKMAWSVASETCALDLIGAKTVREIAPGEMLVISENGFFQSYWIPNKNFLSLNQHLPKQSAFCIFELVYFSRPDSKIFGQSVYEARREMGRQLAHEAPAANAECVIAVPDSSVVAALGYAEAAKLPFEVGFIRSHYVGRTFIEPTQPIRDFRAKIKYNPIKENLKGKKIVLVDDSIVRGTTSKKLIRMLKTAGVKEIHLRVASPPIIGPCYYGIDTPTRSELIAANHFIEQIRKFLGVKTLAYLSLKGMLKAAQSRPTDRKFCTGCFTGCYPTQLYEKKQTSTEKETAV